eukprot:GDKJ01013367.1.p1 GENE.GDKJ01013367.1~~GDKJ01013367.1.p1  ORF type:complete len:208 (+),score=33.60 GDKJ01013367.1:32-655(+)
MARNAERQSAMLNRWYAMKDALFLPAYIRNPRPPEDAETPNECEYWLRDTLKDMGKKIMEIQNASLGEHKIRELNDEINRLIRLKERWENRLRDLGGHNYKLYSAHAAEAMGSEVKGNDGYLYFGAARNLPGVREILEEQRANDLQSGQKQKNDLNRLVKPDYFGWRDEDEIENLLKMEAEKEEAFREQLIANYQARPNYEDELNSS